MSAVVAGLWFLAGAAIEVLNAFTRKWSVERLHDRVSAAWVVGSVSVRLIGTAVLLMLAFRSSVLSGVAALMGYMVCRWVMIWWINRQLNDAGEPADHRP